MKFLILFACLLSQMSWAKEIATVKSPDGHTITRISVEAGSINYRISRKNQEIIKPSKLGMLIRNVGNLSKDLKVLATKPTRYDKTWTQPWGQSRVVRDRYMGAVISLMHIPSQILFDVEFRVFNDGVAFRYIWPEQAQLKYFELDDELSEFHLNTNDQAWWIPAFQDNRYEFLFTKSPVGSLNVVHTPLTVELKNGYTISIHEARLIEYPSMALKNRGNGILGSDLVPWADHIDAKLSAPHQSPWRTIQIAENQKHLIESTMILNLNDPSVIKDTSWIETGKYIGIWWGMHIKKWTWGSGPSHGATTENTKQYIDFAAEHGFKGVLVEGWNHTWDGNWIENGEVFRFDKPYEDWDVDFLANYAKSKGVRLVGHHETAAITTNYLSQLEQAFNFTNRYNMNVIKTGHVGTRLDRKEWHHGQYGVDFYNHVMKYAATRKTMLVVHEPIKQTGLERTYPNLMSTEGARGQEYDGWTWDYGNPPEHTTILPFTRLLAGPMDFTPGTFELFSRGPNPFRVQTTLAKQLALYVVIYAPWQMLSDLPENYLKYPYAFEFLKKVPTNWEKTKGLAARIGDYAVIARKDRESDRWYVGAVTDENARTVQIKLDFLDKGAKYIVNAYQDARDASWHSNPYAMEIYSTQVDARGTFDLHLAAGGGIALELVKVK